MLIDLLLASGMAQTSIDNLLEQLKFLPQKSPEFHRVISQALDRMNDPEMNPYDVYIVTHTLLLNNINTAERRKVIQAVLNKINDQNIRLEFLANLGLLFGEQLKPEERKVIFTAFLNRLKNPNAPSNEVWSLIVHLLQTKLAFEEREKLENILRINIKNKSISLSILWWALQFQVFSDDMVRIIRLELLKRINADDVKLLDLGVLLSYPEDYIPDWRQVVEKRFLALINDPNSIEDLRVTVESLPIKSNGRVPFALMQFIIERFKARISQPDVPVFYVLERLFSYSPSADMPYIARDVLVSRIPSMNLEDLAMVIKSGATSFPDIAQAVGDRRDTLTEAEKITLYNILVVYRITDPNTNIKELVDIWNIGAAGQIQTIQEVLLDRINNPITPLTDLLYLIDLPDDAIKLALDRSFNARRREFTIDMLVETKLVLVAITIYKFLPEDQKQQAVEYLLGKIEVGNMYRRAGEAILDAIQDRILFDEGQTRRAAAAFERLAVLPTPGAEGEDATEVHKFIQPIWDKFVAKLKGVSGELQKLPFENARQQLVDHIAQLDEPMRRQAQVSLERLEGCNHLMQNFRDMWPEIVAVLNDDNQPWNPELPEARSTDGRWAYYLLNSFSASGEAYMKADAAGQGQFSCPEGILERLAAGFWGLHQDLDFQKLGKTLLHVEEKLERFLTSLQDNPAFLSAANKAGRLGYLLNNFRVLYSIGDETWGQLMRKTQTKRDYLVSLKGEEEEA